MCVNVYQLAKWLVPVQIADLEPDVKAALTEFLDSVPGYQNYETVGDVAYEVLDYYVRANRAISVHLQRANVELDPLPANARIQFTERQVELIKILSRHTPLKLHLGYGS